VTYLCRESDHNKVKDSVGCKAGITIEIKLMTANTKKKDTFLQQNPPLQGVVNINSFHNHSTQTAGFLTRLHPSQATKQKLDSLFEDGHGPTSARAACIDVIQVTSDQPAVTVVRGDLIPSTNSVAHSYRKFRTHAIGTHSVDVQLEKLRDKVTAYEEAGMFTTVLYDSFAYI